MGANRPPPRGSSAVWVVPSLKLLPPPKKGDLEPDELLQVIEVLNTGLSKATPALGLVMRTATEGKGLTVDQYCEFLVETATERMKATDAFADWEKQSKGNRPLSDAERLRLNDLEKEVARLKKENTLLKAA